MYNENNEEEKNNQFESDDNINYEHDTQNKSTNEKKSTSLFDKYIDFIVKKMIESQGVPPQLAKEMAIKLRPIAKAIAIRNICAVLIPIIFLFIILLPLIAASGKMSPFEGYFSGTGSSPEYGEKKTDDWASYDSEDAEKQTFYNKLKELAEETNIDSALVLSILFFETSISLDGSYECEEQFETNEEGESVSTGSCNSVDKTNTNSTQLFNDTVNIVDGIKGKNDDEIKEWLKSDYLPKYYKDNNIKLSNDDEVKERVLNNAVDEIYDFRDFYIYITFEEDETGSQGMTCTYNLNGESATNLKVEMLTCDGKSVIQTIDFEEYIRGVVFAEGRGLPVEAMKAQAIMARSYALTREHSMCPSTPDNCNYGYNAERQVIRMRSCENDQAYCNPETGCAIKNPDGGVHEWIIQGDFSDPDSDFVKNLKSQGYTIIAPYSGDQLTDYYNKVDSVKGITLNDESGNVLYTGYKSTEQNAIRNMAEEGLGYEEILLTQYKSAKAAGLSYGCSSKELMPGMLFPIAGEFYNPNCYSAGKYYGDPKVGNYHGAIDFSKRSLYTSAFANREVDIISSTSGIVEYVSDDPGDHVNTYCAYCTPTGGWGYKVRVTDENSPWFGHLFTYWHQDTMNPEIKQGDYIEAGTFLGTMGNSGFSTAAHLHFKVEDQNGADIILDDYVTAFCAANVSPTP